MKRSVFKKKIRRVLSDYITEDDTDVGNGRWLTTATNRIMKTIERAGMRPPEYYDSFDESYGFDWENEEEE